MVKQTLGGMKKPKVATGGGGGRIKVSTVLVQGVADTVLTWFQVGGIALRPADVDAPADVSDYIQLYPESLTVANVGKPSTYPNDTVRSLNSFGLPRKIAKEMGYGSPATVIRQSTVDLKKTLDAAKAGSSKDSRYVLSGARGSGKSTLLIQAVSYALESGWVVLYEPEARKWVDSSSAFAYDDASQTFHQTQLAAQLLEKLQSINKDRLASIKLAKAVEVGTTIKLAEGAKLSELVAAGAKDERLAVPVLEAVLDALATQTSVPVLFAIDDVQCLFQRTKYRKPDYSLLESYHLSTPRLLLQYLTGNKNFAKGAIVGSTSLSATDYLPTAEFLSGLNLETRSAVSPYTKLDEYHLAHAKSGIKTIAVPYGMTGAEAAGMYDLWTRKGWTVNKSDDVFVNGLAQSAGNPQEMVRGWTLSHASYIV